ncbi:MAG: hypothetical protein R3302_06205 [Sulfurimonadaceae bacterium]|nr:hypothetical protein [Sulfurimonadaceae bacterium]
MLKTRTAFVITVLMVGNFAVSLQAVEPRPLSKGIKPSKTKNVQETIATLLTDRGLESATAEKKAAALFSHTAQADLELHHLKQHLGTLLPSNELETVLTRRALFEQSIDLASVYSLTGLLHEVTGRAPDDATLKQLREVAALNSALRTV